MGNLGRIIRGMRRCVLRVQIFSVILLINAEIEWLNAEILKTLNSATKSLDCFYFNFCISFYIFSIISFTFLEIHVQSHQ
jgi:hypothetical protein